jgi:hypothetical protein
MANGTLMIIDELTLNEGKLTEKGIFNLEAINNILD